MKDTQKQIWAEVAKQQTPKCHMTPMERTQEGDDENTYMIFECRHCGHIKDKNGKPINQD